MGEDKAFVDLAGKPLIRHVLERTDDLGQEETILIANDLGRYTSLGFPVYPDAIPEKGSLGGIFTAIHRSRTSHTMVVACDMPFVSSDFLAYMGGLLDEADYDVVVPRVDGYPQGLHALYSKQCLEPISHRLVAGRLKVIGFYEDVKCRFIDEDEYHPLVGDNDPFMNLNTRDDLATARERVIQKRKELIDGNAS